MRMFLILIGVLLFGAATGTAQSSVTEVVGTWEGESVCVVENPCHTEHVIYDIVANKGAPNFTIRADKVVNGQREFMGSFDCTYDAGQHRLSCPMEGRRSGDWVFTVAGDTITGTLTLREGNQLFRNIRVKRVAAK